MVRQELLNYLKAHKWTSLFFVVFGGFWAFTLPYMSYLLGEVVDRLKAGGSLNDDIQSAALILAALYVSIHVLRSLGYYTSGIFSLISVPEFKKNMATKIFNHVGSQSIEYFSKTQPGLIAQKISNVCMSLTTIVFNIFSIIFPQSLAILITGIMLSVVVPYFGFVLWIWGLLLIYYTYRAAKKSRRNSQEFAASCSKYNGQVVDVLTNIHSVLDNYTIKRESNTLSTYLDEVVCAERKRDGHANKVMLTQHIAMNALVAFYLIASIISYNKELLSVGDLVFVMTSVTAIAGLTNSLGNTFLQLLYSIGMLEDGLELLAKEHKIIEEKDAQSLTVAEGEIVIDGIGFKYPSGRKVYDSLCVKIGGKQKVGIVGRSGCGKSTLVKLIMRLYDVDTGKITIDNMDIKKVTKSSLREQISVVPQNLIMFDRTIYENIAYGCKEVTPGQVEAAAKKAYCHDFIMLNELGYQTTVGSNGIKLSGGQRQRIAIARAILKDAPILLLDEATSALDSETEELIQKGINELIRDKTAIIVAHRLSTLREMDTILVMDSGSVVESGNHNELISKDGVYKELWSRQSGGRLTDG